MTEDNPMLQEKQWNEFRDTGLFFYVNQILHAFGWALVVELEMDGQVIRAYPARTKFRGFGQDSIDKGYKKIAAFLRKEAETLYAEAHDDE